jgi:uncharacterized membrane protein
MNTLAITRWINVFSYLWVLMTLAISTWQTKPEQLEQNILISAFILIAFKILPLLLCLPGIIKGDHKTTSWLCFICMIYFIVAVLFLFTKGGEFWGGMLSFSVITLFISSMMYTRFKKASLNNTDF